MIRPREVILAAAFILTALLLQRSALTLLPLPGATPDLLVVVVAAFAVARGPAVGGIVGFAAGLLADLAPPADHAIGRLALVFALAGYLAGLAHDEAEDSALLPIAMVGVVAAFVVLGDAGLGRLFGEHDASWAWLARTVATAVLYDVVLAPFVVPIITMLLRRIQTEAQRR